MELDFTDSKVNFKNFTPRELEEAFEDPFSIRFIPDVERKDSASRYYLLGRTLENRHLFLPFWTDGKNARVIAAREMTEIELRFYQRNYQDFA